jgi:O-antigen/teichoic acid export membrane protein
MIEQIKSLASSKFVTKVGYLGASSFVSQIINLFVLIIMARFFTQNDIGMYSVFLAYASIFTTITILSYQYSLPNLNDQKARDLTYGIFIIIVCTSSIISVGSLIVDYKYALELFVIMVASSIILLTDMLNIRDQRIIFLAFKKIISASLHIALLLVVVITEFNREISTLIWTIVLSNLLVAILYSFSSLRRYLFPLPKLTDIYAVLIKEKNNPIYLAPSNLMGILSYNLPVILIEKFFGASMAAQYSIVLKFCVAPVSLIGDSIANIYHSSVGKSVREQESQAYESYLKIKKYMFILSVLVMIGIIFIFPIIIRFILGPEWEYSARFAQILAPMYAIMLYITPTSMLFFVFNEQKFLLLIQGVYVLIALISFGLASVYSNIWLGVILFSVLSFVRYIFITIKINSISNKLRVSNA